MSAEGTDEALLTEGEELEDWQVLLDDVVDHLFDEEPEPRRPDSLDIAALLDSAADWLRRNGWTQQRPFRMDPETGIQYSCVNGALYRAVGLAQADGLLSDKGRLAGNADWKIQLWQSACAALSAHVGQESWRWNDALGQTKRRVIQTLEELAQELRTAA